MSAKSHVSLCVEGESACRTMVGAALQPPASPHEARVCIGCKLCYTNAR